jgi:hypothetical protein
MNTPKEEIPKKEWGDAMRSPLATEAVAMSLW